MRLTVLRVSLAFLAAAFIYAGSVRLSCAQTGAQKPSSAESSRRPFFRDDFNGSIDKAWTIKKDDGTSSVTSTNLDLLASNGDLWTHRNNYRSLFLISNPAPADFTITVRLDSFVPVSKNHAQFCIVAYDSDDDYVRTGYGFIAGRRGMEIAKEVNAQFTTDGLPFDFGERSFYLQLRKQGQSYRQFYSQDGVNFTQANSPVICENAPSYLGFLVMADPTQSSHAFVDYFEVTETALPALVESVAPADDNASPDAAIQICLRDFTAVDMASFRLSVDDVRQNWTVATNSTGKRTIRYQPPELLTPGSSHSVHFSFVQHNDPLATNSFSYDFSVNPHIIITK